MSREGALLSGGVPLQKTCATGLRFSALLAPRQDGARAPGRPTSHTCHMPVTRVTPVTCVTHWSHVLHASHTCHMTVTHDLCRVILLVTRATTNLPATPVTCVTCRSHETYRSTPLLLIVDSQMDCSTQGTLVLNQSMHHDRFSGIRIFLGGGGCATFPWVSVPMS